MNSSNKAQDELVWEFFSRRRDGFFVEVGANHPRAGSQTWLLEQNGWRGILVEPQEDLFQALCRDRPKSRAFKVACSAPGKTGWAELHVPSKALEGFASLEPNVDDFGICYERTVRVELKTLDALLAQVGDPRVDFVSIDTEGTELDVLRGFDLRRHKPALILIEDKGQSLDKHRFLRTQGYKLVKRTEINNWYVPKGTRFILRTRLERLSLWRKVFLGLPFRRFRRWRHSKARFHCLISSHVVKRIGELDRKVTKDLEYVRQPYSRWDSRNESFAGERLLNSFQQMFTQPIRQVSQCHEWFSIGCRILLKHNQRMYS
jgi:FkbM family methyltransferase